MSSTLSPLSSSPSFFFIYLKCQFPLPSATCNPPRIFKTNTTGDAPPSTHHPYHIDTHNWRVFPRHDAHLLLSSSTTLTLPKHPPKEDVLAVVECMKKLHVEDSLEELRMIDVIQRLGIGHHFQQEIQALLKTVYTTYLRTGAEDLGASLFEAALRFRLLRQGGYPVSANVFKKFKNARGSFTQEADNSVESLMELYEASQESMEGECILEEAQEFCRNKLEVQATQIDDHQARIIQRTLSNPCHMSLKRFTTQDILHTKTECRWMDMLHKLTSIESSIMKSTYQIEMHYISMWLEDMGLSKDMNFARYQPLKWYLWSTACLSDPRLSEERVDLTKFIALIYLMDDIFDVVGALDELSMFTQAIRRWEIVEQLPMYMKTCFNALDKITHEFSFKVYRKYHWNPTNSLQKSWRDLCNAFLVEAKWFTSNFVPKVEEYLKYAIVSSGVHVVLTHTFFAMGEGLTPNTVDYIDEHPNIISLTAKILRLWDDLGSARDENQDGTDGSYIYCYMKDHPGTTVEKAREMVTQIISTTFKQLNKGCLFPPCPLPPSFTKASLNLARMVPLMYSYDNNGGLPLLQEHVESLLPPNVGAHHCNSTENK